MSKQEEITKMTKGEIEKKYGEDTILVAVYGTLRTQQGNHHVLGGYIDMHAKNRLSPLLGEYTTEPIYTMYTLGGFPGIVKGGTTPIKMEVFAVPKKDIQNRIDMLEGYRGEEFTDPTHPNSNFYNKEIIDTPFGEAFTYFYNGRYASEYIIPSGDWLKRDELSKLTNEKKKESANTI